MKEENEGTKSKDSADLASETQAFEMEFIKCYENLPVLWDTKHPDYTNKYRRGIATDVLLKILKKWDSVATRRTVARKINTLRSTYRKDLRKHLLSKTIGPDGEEIYEYTSKSWKFYALKFLGGKLNEDLEHLKNINITEIDLDNTNFQEVAEEDSEKSDNDESSLSAVDVLQTISDDKTYHKQSHSKKDKNNRKRVKLEVQDFYVNDPMLDKEFEAIGANVSYKLKRMNPQQRCHAELLINKVLIAGLKNNLTDDTDLTEVYK